MTETNPNPANLSGCCGAVRFKDMVRVDGQLYGEVSRCGKCIGISGPLKLERGPFEFKTEAVARVLAKRRNSSLTSNDFTPEDRVKDRQRLAAGEGEYA